MPTAETMLREAAERDGWTIREFPPVPGEVGFIELRGGLHNRVVLRAEIPRQPLLGYDPWDALYQAMAQITTS